MINSLKNQIASFYHRYGNREALLYLWKNHLLAIIALVGLFTAILFAVIMGRNSSLPSHELRLPPSSPFVHNISGTGFVEANTRNISIGSFASGIVSKVYVSEGEVVKKGTPLFSLDNRTSLADVSLKKRRVEAAQSNLDVTRVTLHENQDHLNRAEKMKSGFSISSEDHQKRRFAVEKLMAQTKLQESELEQAKAHLELALITLDQLTVQAPVDGIILKVGIRLGERISETTSTPQGLILMGNNTPLHIRVQIDENDGWRFDAQSKAVAYLKSNRNIHFPLKFVRLEPYAQQKQQISGESTELIDTRIIECVYEMPNNIKDIYIGQQLDIFIEAKQEP